MEQASPSLISCFSIAMLNTSVTFYNPQPLMSMSWGSRRCSSPGEEGKAPRRQHAAVC